MPIVTFFLDIYGFRGLTSSIAPHVAINSLAFNTDDARVAIEGQSDEQSGTGDAVNVKSSAISATTARLGYNTGHGDFCFGRLVDRPERSIWDGSVYDDEFWKAKSNGLPIVELDQFQR